MSISIPEFWKLVIESRLLAAEQCQQLAVSYGHVKGAAGQGTAKSLAEWLISINAISKYQADIVLAGRAGPFVYGEYKVYDRVTRDRLAGWFRAVHVPTNHPVLLQFLTGVVTQDARYWGAAVGQTQARAALVQPHLQRFYEAVDCGPFKFLVSEDLQGESLADTLARAGRLPPGEVCRAMRLAASALAQLHHAGQLHGEVRPANLWLEPNGNVKLLHDPASFPAPPNLGLDDSANQQRADYFAPEFAQPGKTPDVLTDIYALGCTFYQLLAGQPPFPGGNVMQKLTRHATEAIQSLEPLGVTAAIAQLVAYLMAKNPAVRYQQADVVAEQLTPYVDPASHVSPASPPPTLPVYENFLRQPRTAPAPQPATVTPLQTVVMPTSAAAQLAPASAANAPGVGVNIATSSSSAPPRPKHTAGTERLRATQKKSKNMALIVAISVGAAVVMLVIGMVILNATSGGASRTKDQTAAKEPDENEGDGSDTTKQNLVAHNTPGSLLPPVKKPPDDSGEKSKLPGPGGKKKTGSAESTAETPSATPRQTVVPDDGQLLWASPTSGTELNLDYLPHDARIYLHCRPHDMAASDEGGKVLPALGPAFAAARSQWEAAAGVRFNHVDELLIGFYVRPNDLPQPAFVVRLREASTPAELLDRWGQPEQAAKEKFQFYLGKEWAYFIPADADGKVFVMGARAEIENLAETHGAPPVLRRELGKLHKVSDRSRHFNLLFTPNILFSEVFTEGRKLFFGDATRLQEPLAGFLRKEDLQAGMVSMHFGGESYFEMRFVGNVGKDNFALAKDYRDRLEKIPDALFDYTATLGSNPYWEKVRMRYPNMISYMHKQTRVGEDNNIATINCVLPGLAAHNLVFGTEMLLASRPGAAAVAVVTGGPAESPYKTIDDVLNKFQTKVSFESKSLEFAIQDIATDVNESIKGLPFVFKIKIMGDDLKLDGLTRNQSVNNFTHSDKTVGEILTALMLKCDPVKAPDPSDPKQRLLWVVDKDPDDPSKPIVLVTTRQGVEKHKYKLPAMFQPK